MDGDRFDNIARALASGQGRPTSRRTFLAGLAGGVLAAAGLLPARGAGAQVSQAYCGNVNCGSNPGKCKPGCICCVLPNGNSRCRPPDSCGGPGQVVCPPGMVSDPAQGCVCAQGFANCDGNAANGCETPLGTNQNCGFCGDVCDGLGETCGAVTPGVCACVDNGAACGGAVCGTAVNNCGVTVTCGSLGGNCPSGQSCQAGACACPAGTCGAGCALVVCPDGSCKQGATGACAADGDCCSGVCVGGVCLGGCVAESGVCDSGADCCVGACVTPVGGTGARLCCASGKACGANCCADGAQVCDGSGACCTPKVCQPGQCGTYADGCGRGLDCGGCTEPGETCGGGGTPGVCGSCTPADPAIVCAGTCGTVPDGCGDTFQCETCGSGLTCCNGECVNLSNDVDNCRECGRVCQSDPATCTSATCVGGNCIFSTVVNCCHSDDECLDANPCTVSTCDPRTLTCWHDPDSSTDNTPCGTGQICCAGACIDASDDPANCGTCGNTCTENQPCDPCPSGQLCPDRGPGCCESGTCSAGQCTPKALPLCGSCATPLCDPDLGSICVSNCPPPPDVCHTGPGTCRLDGTCVYPPKCGLCESCDPITGTCTPKVCGPCEQCDPDSGQCVTTCTTPPHICGVAPGVCEDGRCNYAEKDCGPCAVCDFNRGCTALQSKQGTTCGTCRICDAGECVPVAPGTVCENCGVCDERGRCALGLAPDGTSCGDCKTCSGGFCSSAAAEGISCGDGRVCDGSGACVCALQCGPHCCPDSSVACCVLAGGEHPDNYACCSAPCTPLPPNGSFCSS